MNHYQTITEKHATADAAQLVADVAEVMRLPAVRRLFMRILVSGGIYRISEHGDNQEYLAGRRDAALHLMNTVNRHALDNALLAQIESNEHVTKLEQERQSAMTQDILEKKGK